MSINLTNPIVNNHCLEAFRKVSGGHTASNQAIVRDKRQPFHGFFCLVKFRLNIIAMFVAREDCGLKRDDGWPAEISAGESGGDQGQQKRQPRQQATQCSRRLPSAQECGACGVEIALVDQRLRFARNRGDSSAFFNLD